MSVSLTVCAFDMRSSVYPSGADLAAASVPTTPRAGRFSMTNGLSERFSETRAQVARVDVRRPPPRTAR
jgi:hypothetical protein